MEQRRIGVLEVSIAGLGTNNFGRRLDAAQTRDVVHAALAEGVTLIDTAETYGEGRSEEYIGRALGGRRDEAVIATKFGYQPAREAHDKAVPRALEGSLRRLGTDHVDLYYYHKPDPSVPIGDTLEAMDRLVEQGKVREIACSNFSVEQLEEAERAAHERGLRRFAAVENEFSLLEREPLDGVLETAERLGMTLRALLSAGLGTALGQVPPRPGLPPGTRLGGEGGRLAEDVVAPARLDAVERLAGFAAARGHTLLELAMSWLVSHRQVASVIAGATRPEQVRANVAAVTAWKMDDDGDRRGGRAGRAARGTSLT